ncbi:cytosolic purine 5'-nucleotidase isoform X2 [Lepeophtheirus salmonis]
MNGERNFNYQRFPPEPTRSIQENMTTVASSVTVPNGGTPMKNRHRPVANRVFVNKSLHLDKIKFYGFDMDYTLAEYKSPEYEILGFDQVKTRLVEEGYPEAILDFEYDPDFPSRGLWFDTLLGNLLKVDAYGNILVCVHGFRFLKTQEIREKYPNGWIQLDDSRIYVVNTLFNLPETHFLACIVDYFTNSPEYIASEHGFKYGEVFMSFKSIFQDVRSSVDYVHCRGNIKKRTIEKVDKYVNKDPRLPMLLQRIRESGAKTFLLTNSEWWYTDALMNYLFDFPDVEPWRSYFNFVVVDGRKPLFFGEGTSLRRVQVETGKLVLGHHTGDLKEGAVYSGGSCDVMSKLIGAKGKDVLYVGDHIFGDVLKSKKLRGWRTFLIVPELDHELHVWTDKRQLFDKLASLDAQLADLYLDLDSSAKLKPDISKIRSSMQDAIYEMDISYGLLGSLFRSGSRQTFFCSQLTRYADIYAASVLNLLYYPFSYIFRAPPMLMPHESTVDHEADELSGITEASSRREVRKGFLNRRTSSLLPNAFPEAPGTTRNTHELDDFDDEDDLSGSPNSCNTE